jgi:DNA-binding transcriptional ArsR family regulator
MSAAKSSSEEAVIKALASHGDLTVADIAAATGLGRSTVGKALARLGRAGLARRSAGGREGGRRLPDRWSVAPSDEPSRMASDRERLRPGQLDGLVLDYLKTHGQTTPLGPTAMAKGLGRSTGAVGNCLIRLTAAGQVRQVSEHPRRYSTAAPRSRRRPGTRPRKGKPS